jgi:hypothetical protein
MTRYPMILQAPDVACDIVGDVHGQADALFALLARSGWHIPPHDLTGNLPIEASHPEGRFLLFAGDLVNKGPDSIRVLRLVMGLVRRGRGLSVRGNHEAMLLDALKHPNKTTKKSVRKTAKAIRKHGHLFAAQVEDFLESLPAQIRVPMPQTHTMFGDGWLTVVHAACPKKHLDCETEEALHRNVFGFTEKEERGFPDKKRPWGKRYKGSRWIIHGHTPAFGLLRTRRTLCLDAGAAEGSNLALLRLDAGELMVQPVFMAPKTNHKSPSELQRKSAQPENGCPGYKTRPARCV